MLTVKQIEAAHYGTSPVRLSDGNGPLYPVGHLKRVDTALYSLRRQLAEECGYTFHTFDTAFIAYHSKTRSGADIGGALPELFKG